MIAQLRGWTAGGGDTKARVRTRPRAVIASTVGVTIETFFADYVNKLTSEGYEVHLVSSDSVRLGNLSRPRMVASHKIAMTRRISPSRDLTALVVWLRFLLLLRPKLLISMTPKAALLCNLAGMLARCERRVYLTGGLRLETESGWRLRILLASERLTCAVATEVIANSPSLAQLYLRHRLVSPRKLAHTDPGSSHGVDGSRFAPATAEERARAFTDLNLVPNVPVVLFVGRLTRDKGVIDLVEGARMLESRVTPVQYLFVGPTDEPDSKAILSLLQNSNLLHVTTGALSDVRGALSVADVLALPSYREGFPNVVLEAACMGLPSIVSDATGCVDSVKPGVTGIVVPKGQASALADALHQLLINPTLRMEMGRQARWFATQEFRPRRIVSQVVDGTCVYATNDLGSGRV